MICDIINKNNSRGFPENTNKILPFDLILDSNLRLLASKQIVAWYVHFIIGFKMRSNSVSIRFPPSLTYSLAISQETVYAVIGVYSVTVN